MISSQDGHRYYFGWGRSERTSTATASVFTVPVVGNDAGEPCHDQFPEPCTQAWRWNLDRAVTANEVETMYFYDKEYNHYRSVANSDKAREYVSSGYVKEIREALQRRHHRPRPVLQAISEGRNTRLAWGTPSPAATCGHVASRSIRTLHISVQDRSALPLR
ncbi:hypothetical protein ACIBCS_36295 [Streptomyces phaeochromogenes]|uniref:hypothetical protein n=1 Tax=Streptomyces phaeochromogenes TaxID=1923 RepID=UPI003403C501